MESIVLSVRRLLAFVMRSGDIDNTYRSNQRMLEGMKAHQRLQAAYGAGYRKEVVFRDETILEEISFQVEGRADGVYEGAEGPMIDEIKSTTRALAELDPEANQLHWAQAKCYAHFYCKQRSISSVRVQLTYVNLEEADPVKKCEHTFSAEDLEAFYLDLLGRYLRFSRALLAWRAQRNASIDALRFPYPAYRKGQRKMAVGVYQAIEEGRALFLEAPTGIGKTMSALVPAIASLRRETSKIFYLTARTTTQREAERALALLESRGLQLKSLCLTAKERICCNERLSCNPTDCPYAKGHFDRVNEAILALFQEETRMTREVVEQAAQTYCVCPFELQLDLSEYAEVIVGDYNYVFDPQAYLQRAFEEPGARPVFLVDEAHNLVDRARAMYSAELSRAEFQRMGTYFPAETERTVHRALQKAVQKMEEVHAALGGQAWHVAPVRGAASEGVAFSGAWASAAQVLDGPDEDFYECLQTLLRRLDPYLSHRQEEAHYEEVLAFRFRVGRYAKIFALRRPGFFHFLRAEGADLQWEICCIDTSSVLAERLSLCRAAIFFSATLSPLRFYQELLGGGKQAAGLRLPSPFAPSNLRVLRAEGLSTRYRDRHRSLSALCAYIHSFYRAKAGNYMVFFPSYQYMEQVAEAYRAQYEDPVFCQQADWTQAQCRAVFARYDQEQELLGFFVLGGLFAEGVDLAGVRLIGVGIVSVGLPGLSRERDVIQHYFDAKDGRGFDYAYTFPGMNKVLQAAGRVIRSAEDRGIVFLLDERFGQAPYQRLLPASWQVQEVRSVEEVRIHSRQFWNDDAKGKLL